MKAGVLHLNIKQDRVNDFKKSWDQFVSELHQKISGFQTAFMFINPDNGKCTSIGIYDSAESAKTLPSSASYNKFLSNCRDCITGEPSRELCDVSGELESISAGKKAA